MKIVKLIFLLLLLSVACIDYKYCKSMDDWKKTFYKKRVQVYYKIITDNYEIPIEQIDINHLNSKYITLINRLYIY